VSHHVNGEPHIHALLTPVLSISHDFTQSNVHPVKRLDTFEPLVFRLDTRRVILLSLAIFPTGHRIIIENFIEGADKASYVWLVGVLIAEQLSAVCLDDRSQTPTIYKKIFSFHRFRDSHTLLLLHPNPTNRSWFDSAFKRMTDKRLLAFSRYLSEFKRPHYRKNNILLRRIQNMN